MRILIDNIINQLQSVQNDRIWVGANFDTRLSSITDAEAFLRPIDDLHSVAEIISHLTAWRNDAITKITTGKGQMTEDSTENWRTNDQLRELGFESIKGDYQDSLGELIALLKSKDDAFLQEKYYDADFKGYFEYRFAIEGLLHHDLYHMGQLGIIIKFLKLRGQ